MGLGFLKKVFQILSQPGTESFLTLHRKASIEPCNSAAKNRDVCLNHPAPPLFGILVCEKVTILSFLVCTIKARIP